MADNSLQADLTALRSGAAQFSDHHLDLRETLGKIHTGHDSLQETWTGTIADTIAAKWEELHPRIGRHYDHISDHSQHLGSAATEYGKQDEANANSFVRMLDIDGA
jgi:WXG100 family type VII secretion target